MAKILILDDEPNILLSLTRALELESYEVATVKTIAEARRAFGSMRFEVALLDLKLPDGLGIDLLSEVVRDEDHPPIIMMSGHGTIEDAVKALHLGASDFLEKPIGQDRLLHTIQSVLELSRLKEEN